MADNWRSRTITQGAARSPNRAMLRAVGFGDGDFEKAIVGVASGHSTMNPCNAGIQPLVDSASAAVKAAGAMPQVFGFPTVTDGIGMGTEGMKYSLVSREVIADSIETAVNGQLMDGVLCVGGCDKNMPGAMMAMARINVPGIFVYAGTIKPGFWKGQKLTIVSPFEAVGALAAGKISQEDFDGIERIRRKVPVLCNLKPSGPYVATDFHAAGGVPQVLKMLLAHGLVHGECLTITGRTLAEELANVPEEPRAGQDVIRPWSNPVYAQGHLAILRGNLAT